MGCDGAYFKPSVEEMLSVAAISRPARGATAVRLDTYLASLAGSFEVVARQPSQLRGGTKGTRTREMLYLLRPL